jgi:hypothetical protein
VTFGYADDWTAETADRPQAPVLGEGGTDVTRGHAGDTRVREDNTSTSDVSAMSDCGSAEPTAEPTADTDSDRRRGDGGRVGAWLWARFVRFDIAQDRPGLAKIAAYAYHGAGAPADGPLRDAQIRWYRLVAPVIGWLYWQAWALERPFKGVPVLIWRLVWLVLDIDVAVHIVRLLT